MWATERDQAVVPGKSGNKREGDCCHILLTYFSRSPFDILCKQQQVGKATGRLHTFIVEPFCAHTDADELYVAIFSQRYNDVIMFYEHGGVDVGDVDQKVGKATGRLHTFIVEPFCAHTDADELYVAIFSQRYNDVIMFYEHGGVDVGDARSINIAVSLDENEMMPTDAQLTELVGDLGDRTSVVKTFITSLYSAYKSLYFTYLEINPLVVKNGKVYILDLAAKLDETANFLCSDKWKTRAGSAVEFPAPFGRDLTKEEEYIADLDSKTGASLKLTILNRKGRIWTMVAGGGASVVFADTICDLGGASELANYGEYSGDPSETQTFEYAKTLLSVMTEGPPHPQGKVLIIGGSIANFTNVAKTFGGIVRAFEVFIERLHEHKVTIYVRRGGPNYQEGLRKIKEAAQKLDLPMHVFGPETHMTSIVGPALGVDELPSLPHAPQTTGQFLLSPERNTAGAVRSEDVDQSSGDVSAHINNDEEAHKIYDGLFEKNTKAIVWGQQQRAIQGMLDFDYVCRRSEPSVVASTYPFTGDNKQKYYFGQREILIPAYKSMAKAFATHPDATVMVTFASLRSVYETVLEALQYPQIRVIAIIAEGVPENQTRRLIKVAGEKGVTIIGPATVGGIKPGCFKIGNTGGMMDNILSSKLYRPGSVAYVSRSGGLSNELNNIIGLNSDGVFEGIAIGGDRYPGSTYTDHILRYQNDDRVKMIVLLGEVGGIEEYKIVDALKDGRITKPLVAWCIGTCADHITSEVQFGHAGASANATRETAVAKNAALKAAGAHVPHSFNDLEGVPENQTRRLIKVAGEKGVTIIGPATVGGIKPGCFKIGNTGGMMDNILSSKLYRPGSVAYVSRSGGLSNELNNIIGLNSDGVFEGIAIGGDRYPGSTYTDHILRYQNDDRVKMIVLLGEVGGIEEYKIVDALKDGRITKPLVAWCIGTCADHITSEVQFGHAGASANATRETAVAKNAALKAAGAHVPHSFNDLGKLIKKTFDDLVAKGVVKLRKEVPPPAVPMDYAWARELGLIRKPASFMTSICDERGEELLYAGVPITKVLQQDMGIGGVLSLLWFQKRLPAYANKFIEICLMITADHGPAVSGAHNTIVCARAGKDLISSLVSGLLTIGDRFGGALDGAARQFSEAVDKGWSAMQFVNEMRKQGKHIMGIGHRVKSINNPDKRVEILKNFALDRNQFKQDTPLLEYALEVEKITTAKKPNLILNVDGAIGIIFVDILRNSGMFTPAEAQETIEIGALNGLFVLGRSVGFIGHYLDQRRLKQGLYRHPWDDISYVMPERDL
ncbi:CoA binding domain protein [Oesophagostomum dentatum]|uniref:ATP citrate synthase n=2 Tax=Oesophagostomum dentatum TaxID=61180 RepID=A0A0B1SXB7_OESDE|nr:CoA binding domain protein [Oesophagostomum dentatum]